MPTAPVYGNQKASVTALPSARLTATPAADTFGASAGEAVAKAGAGIYGHELELQNQVRIEELTNKADEVRRKLTFGQPGDDPGFKASMGSQVMERESGKPLSAEYLEKWDQQTQAILASAANDVQRANLQHRFGLLRKSFANDLDQHEYHQTRAHGIGVADATVAGAINNAALRYENDDEIATSRARLELGIQNRAQLAGLSGESLDTYRAGKVSDFHNAVIATALGDNKLSRAQAYFDANQGQIEAGDRIAIQAKIRETTRRVEGEAWDVVSHGVTQSENRVFSDPSRYGTEREAQIGLVNGLPDVSDKLRTKMRNEIDTRLSTARVLGMAEVDPVGTAAMLRGKATTPAPVIQGGNVIDRLTSAIKSAEGSKPDAVSPQGAVGSMQITRATFKDYARPGEFFDNEADRVAAAQRKIQADFEFYGGDVMKVAAAYIGGRGAVKADGTIRDDVKDAHGTTPLAYAKRVVSSLGLEKQPDRMPATGDRFVDGMPLDQRFRLLRQVETQAHQRQSLAQHQLRSRLQDFQAMAANGVDIPAASIPREEDLRAAFGDADGPRIYQEQVAPALQLNADVKDASRLPNDQHAALYASRAPRPGDTYAEDLKRQAILRQAIERVQKQRDDDPAAYVLANAPQVRKALEAAQSAGKDPSATRLAYARYADAMLAEQNRLGMSQALLSKPAAENIVAQFYNQGEGGQNAAQLIRSLSEQWGKHWNSVYGQIAKQIPSAARTIGAGMPEGPAMLLAGLADVKAKDLKEGLPADVDKDIKTQLDKQFEQGRISLVATNPRSGNDTFNSIYGDAEKLALHYVRSTGKSATEAARQAFDDTFGHRYEIVKSGPAYYRVPKGQDSSAISAGADVVRANIGMLDLQLPASRAGLDEKQIRAAWVDQLKADSHWVTAPDESGLVLYNANNAAVLDAKGTPIWRSWYALQQAGQTGSITAKPTPPGSAPINTTPGGAATGRVYGTDSTRRASR